MDQWVKDILAKTPVVPVITIEHPDCAVPLAKALMAGGIPVLEVTLRTPHARQAIAAIKAELPEAIVGAGTVISETDIVSVKAEGADFMVSPGLTPSLLQAANSSGVPLLPGISSISEMMLGIECGIRTFKFFPAEAAGGVKMLKAFAGPFADIKFCPTGGISLSNMNDYLALESVLSVGGSWLCPTHLVRAGDWDAIQALAAQAVTAAGK